MTVTTVSSREFNQDASAIKKASLRGPVVITDRGRPAHVLLSIEHYRQLAGSPANLVEMLASLDLDDIEFEAPRASKLYKAPRLA